MLVFIVFYRPCWTREVSQDDIIWPYFWISLMRHAHGWCKCGVNWHVKGASCNLASPQCPGSSLYNQGILLSTFRRYNILLLVQIDMTPPNVLAETIKQVTKILKSPGCRKTPVFVNSLESAVEVSQVFAAERLVPNHFCCS